MLRPFSALYSDLAVSFVTKWAKDEDRGDWLYVSVISEGIFDLSANMMIDVIPNWEARLLT